MERVFQRTADIHGISVHRSHILGPLCLLGGRFGFLSRGEMRPCVILKLLDTQHRAVEENVRRPILEEECRHFHVREMKLAAEGLLSFRASLHES